MAAITWRGRRAMRISVCNWRTSEADLDRAVAAARRALGSA
jgi:aromatic-L-amino-acid decarboxylase